MSTFSVAATYPTHLPAEAPSDVRASIRISASGVDARGVAVALRLWTPFGATVTLLRERRPATRDLGDRAIGRDDQTVQYAAGHWTDGAREYELAVALPAGRAGDEMLAARLEVLVGDGIVGRALVAVTWTADARLIAPGGHRVEPSDADADAVAELPTGPSPTPRHTQVDDSPAVASCPACDLRAEDGEHFCERCGQELVVTQKS